MTPPVCRRINFSWRHIGGIGPMIYILGQEYIMSLYRTFVYIIDHIYFTNNGSKKIKQTK